LGVAGSSPAARAASLALVFVGGVESNSTARAASRALVLLGITGSGSPEGEVESVAGAASLAPVLCAQSCLGGLGVPPSSQVPPA